MSPTRPVLRYHGGKWRLAPWIISHFPDHKVYVEPFGGAASVLMRKARSYCEVYNDLDGEVVNVFRVLRDRQAAEYLCHLLRLTPYAYDEFQESYKKTKDPIEQARRTIIKACMGFGSASVTGATSTSPGTGFRSCSSRSGTTPSHDFARYPDLVLSFVERLQGVVIENKPAERILVQHDGTDTLHYIDPPYLHSTRAGRKWRRCKSYRHEMTDQDHIELLEIVKGLKGMAIISSYQNDIYADLLSDWTVVSKQVAVDSNAKNPKRTECLWLNPAALERSKGTLMEVSA